MRTTNALVLTLVLLIPATASAQQGGKLTADGKPITRAELYARARAATVVYVGEEHGQAQCMRLQADILEAMAEKGPVALGCEYFPRSMQPILDRFNRGEISLADFPKAVHWKTTWGFPWKVYRPLFAVAAARRIPVVALNAERDVVHEVMLKGLLGLPLDTLAALPSMDLTNAAHRERVTGELEQVHPVPKAAMERYYEAFTLWDETMASSVAEEFLRDRRPNLKMLVVAGRGHIETGTGIPDRVTRRFPAKRLTVVYGQSEPGDGDILFVPRKPRSGWF